MAAEAGDDDPAGCPHYRRRCSVKAPCCGQFYTCHNCHDEAMLLSNACSVEMKGSSAGARRLAYVCVLACDACSVRMKGSSAGARTLACMCALACGAFYPD